MKDHKDLKGGILPMILGTVLFEGIINPLIEQKRQEEEQHQRNIAWAEEKERRKREAEEFQKAARAQRLQDMKEEQELRAIEMSAMTKIYQKQKELQNKAAAADVGRAQQRQALQRELEQQRVQNKTEMERLAQQQRLQQSALEAQRRSSQQQRAAEDTAKLRSIQQLAVSQIQSQLAPQASATRRMAAPVSTTLITRRGRGYNNEVLAMLQSYYGISLKEAKKLYKQYF
jgi:hypothetical protein